MGLGFADEVVCLYLTCDGVWVCRRGGVFIPDMRLGVGVVLKVVCLYLVIGRVLGLCLRCVCT